MEGRWKSRLLTDVEGREAVKQAVIPFIAMRLCSSLFDVCRLNRLLNLAVSRLYWLLSLAVWLRWFCGLLVGRHCERESDGMSIE